VLQELDLSGTPSGPGCSRDPQWIVRSGHGEVPIPSLLHSHRSQEMEEASYRRIARPTGRKFRASLPARVCPAARFGKSQLHCDNKLCVPKATSSPGCSQLARVEVRAAQLRDLNLSGCGRLRDTHRPSLVVLATSLTRLVLAQCHDISAVEHGTFPQLQELNLHGCRELRDTGWIHLLFLLAPPVAVQVSAFKSPVGIRFHACVLIHIALLKEGRNYPTQRPLATRSCGRNRRSNSPLAAFQALVQPAKGLRRLIACGCSLKHLTLEGYEEVEEVDVSGCNSLEDVVLRSPVLAKFAAKHCETLSVGLFFGFSSLRYWEELAARKGEGLGQTVRQVLPVALQCY